MGYSPWGCKESDMTGQLSAAQAIRWGFPVDPAVKNLPANAGDAGSIPGLQRSPGKENGNSLHYSCLGNPMDRGVWRATVDGVTKCQIRLSN